ncbi:MAG TPA: RluA family pseudouridine synthase [Spirochaetota bacterium]
MSERILEIIIPDDAYSVRLDRYLSSRFDYMSRSSWQREIESGKITLNGTVDTNPARKVKGKDHIAYDGKGIEERPVDDEIEILYEDEQIIALGKSGDLPVHPAGRYFNNTLTMIMEKRLGRKIYPVHRLDRETSGVILSTFNTDDVSSFASALQSGMKEYLALVYGDFPEGEMVIDLPIGPDEKSVIKKKRKAFPGAGESAETIFRLERRLDGFSLVRAFPQTGRLHQIRVHLLAAGFPIVGDKLYCMDDNLFLEFIKGGMTDSLAARLILPRSALHAERITFIHPVTKKEMIIVSPLPRMFTDFIERRNHG